MSAPRRYQPEPTRPLEMAESHWLVLCRLTDEKRTAVLERASLVHEGNPGMSWDDADASALAQVLGIPTQRKLVGT